ncbi:hypothetical protein L486_02027 [Kwoniella mangroviensis CBS 10435]|uniref:Uncharacterized protein n=1 Tax=Kwoniella mangroviensis CBS 10435 TaxID=1331196 RepID=A0A1B9J3M2_9TREE|nr:hypothetical protein L486_02027 [Kwoniella mangroviensis CBS 10435]
MTTIVFREKMFSRNTSTLYIPLGRFEDIFSQLKRYFAQSSICLHLPIPPLHELVGLVGISGPHSNIDDLVFVKEWMEGISTNLKGDQLVLHNIHQIDTSVARYFAPMVKSTWRHITCPIPLFFLEPILSPRHFLIFTKQLSTCFVTNYLITDMGK